MGETGHDERRASTRVDELEDKIQQAAALIGELRETNYSLSGEVAELRRALESRGGGENEGPVSETTGDADDEAYRAELDALRKERKAIRAKVARLLEKVEKLETSSLAGTVDER